MTIRPIIKIIFVIIFLPALASGQNNPRTILWEISKPGIQYKSYLFGTFHEVNATFFSSLTNSLQKLEQATTLYVEQKISDSITTSASTSKLQSWDVEKWDKVMDEHQRFTFKSFVQKSEDTTYYSRPPFILQLILVRLYLQNFCDTSGRESGELMDNYIENLMLSGNKKVYSLDSSQVNILASSSSYDDNIRSSLLVQNCIDLMSKMLANDPTECDLIDNYKNFNINYEFEKEINNTYDQLQLNERNKKWLMILDKAFRENKCFVAVGFRHLMYKKGLIQILRDVGYIVTPVNTR